MKFSPEEIKMLNILHTGGEKMAGANSIINLVKKVSLHMIMHVCMYLSVQ